MEKKAVEEKIVEIANAYCDDEVINYNNNLFDYGLESVDIVNIAIDIETAFAVSLNRLFGGTNYLFFTINNLTNRVYTLAFDQN